MASDELVRATRHNEIWIENHEIDEKAVDAYMECVKTAFLVEKDIVYACKVGRKAKNYIRRLVKKSTGGGTLEKLEEWAQANKVETRLINQYYDVLLLESKYRLDSFKLYMERRRPRADRFYETRRPVLKQLTDAVQELEEGRLDELYLHMPPRVGKLLADDTPVLTKDGWKTHGDLAVGDFVVGSDGGYAMVTKVYPKAYADYKVALANGESFVCHGNHEWYVLDVAEGDWELYETAFMAGRVDHPDGIYNLFVPFVLKKNIPGLSPGEGLRFVSGIKSIEKCDPVPGNCISVQNTDGLYAVGKEMCLTHNSQDVTFDIAWHIGRDMEKSNLYVTYKDGLGGAFVDGVMEVMTDPTYAYADVFPEARIVDTDALNHKMDVGRKKKYKSLSGKGIESGLNGEYDATGWLVVDDPLEGVQDVLSEDVLKRKKIIFNNNVMSRRKERCALLGIGTLWDPNDIFMSRWDFLETSPEAKNVKKKRIMIPALDDKDQSNFDYPGGFSTAYYRGLRSGFEMNEDMAGWFAQYQQDPVKRGGSLFKPEHMKYFSELPGGEPLKVIAFCDVALGGGDFLSFPVACYYEDGEGYVVDVVFDKSEKHVTQPEVVAAIRNNKVTNVRFEANQGGEGYKDDIVRMLREDGGPYVNVTSAWAPTTKRKAQRIFDAAEQIRKLNFLVEGKRGLQYRKFMQNLFAFTMEMGRKRNDDAPDSLAGLVAFDRDGSGVGMAVVTGPML